MDLQHRFTIPVGLDRAWQVLRDIPGIAPCVPGVELTEVVDDRHFLGAARIRLGPVQLRFAGDAEILELDDTHHAAKVRWKGKDGKGRGSADANVDFRLSDAGGDNTQVDVHTDLNLSGSIAQYGRASGLIDEVAKRLIADFVANLEVALHQGEPPGAVQTGAAETAAATADPGAGGSTPIGGLRLLLRVTYNALKRLFRGT